MSDEIPGAVYKIFRPAEWNTAQAEGVFRGSPDDARDGFIHLSTAAQVHGTLARHFASDSDLVLATVDVSLLGDALKWEVSRGGQEFPHLYAGLPLRAILRILHLSRDSSGNYLLPDGFP